MAKSNVLPMPTMTQQQINIPIKQVRVESRHRKDLGELSTLTASIEQLGLLQPIGIDPSYRLIFGERRLKAFQLLGRDTIPAMVIDIDSLLGEHDENIVRKDFTVSERVAIGRSLEARTGERRGRPSTGEIPPNWAEFNGKETRELAADKAGFDSKNTYLRAKRVVEHGAPELIAAMDAGEVSVSAAAEIATLPKDKQMKAVKAGKEKILAEAKEIKREQRRRRQAARSRTAQEQAAKNPLLQGVNFRLIVGRFMEVHASIPDQSIHAIITDPPYARQYLSDYESLAEFANQKLVNGGLCLVMTGQSFLQEVLENLSKYLRYQWTLAYVTPGESTQIWGRKIKSNWKPVVMMVKGKIEWEHSKDTFFSDKNDKQFHEWGQSVGGMAQLIEHFTTPAQIICDPFCGAGTTGVAALSLGRRFIGIDMENAHIATASERLIKVNQDQETVQVATDDRVVRS